jgi:serine/threonine protein kinase/mannitol/fructose-specific phosphotransferase system IIA component (Ntr-type)
MHASDQREEAIFRSAVGLPPGDQGAYLDQVCKGNQALRQRVVERLFHARKGTDAALSQPSARTGIEPVVSDRQRAGAEDRASPARVGDYELLEELGGGGMGIVFKARQLSLNRLVALKLMNAQALAAGEAGLKRFRLEAEALAQLDHPNIVSIYEMGEAGGQYYFSMRLIEGGDLSKAPDQFTSDLRLAAGLLVTVSRAVHHAHQRGILHRDLKLSNILLDKEGKPHVTDFGLAKLLERNAELTGSGMILGTPEYMAPEQAKGLGKHADKPADIFSLGVVLYRLITGRLPFKGPTDRETIRRIIEAAPERPALLNPAVDVELERICLRCLEKEESCRYDSAEAMAKDLEGWSRRVATPGKPATPPVRRVRCKLDYKESRDPPHSLHFRPAQFMVKLCRSFPNTEFRVFKEGPLSDTAPEPINPKNIMELVFGEFEDGDVITLEVSGQFEVMAAESFKVAWEHLGYTGNFEEARARLIQRLDDTCRRIYDPDLEEFKEPGLVGARGMQAAAEQEYRFLATINDRLHDLSLQMIPLIARHFSCRLQILFDLPDKGVFRFVMEQGNDYELDGRILDLDIGVGTRITVLASGAEGERAGRAVRDVLDSLWQCDEWLRRKSRDFGSAATILELVEFAKEMARFKSAEYGYVNNPFISNLLTTKHVQVNGPGVAFTKEAVLNQLAAPHARLHGLDFSVVLERVRDSEQQQPVLLRPGFAVAHGVMDRGPRISITFGVYPQAVKWNEDAASVTLVAMVIRTRDTYRTWRDYMKRVDNLFKSNPALQGQLVAAKSSEEFLATLRNAETALVRV